MTVSARIYAGGSVLFGGQGAIDDLIAAGYDAVILWTIHVRVNGDLVFNDTPLVIGGSYQSDLLGDFADRLARLTAAGIKVIFCVGEDKQHHGDFYNIYNILTKGSGSTEYKNLYGNFSTLLSVMTDAGTTIDAIDMDNEDYFDNDAVTPFATMLQAIGYPSVSFCPYANRSDWKSYYDAITKKFGASFVSAIHLQCYSGGSYNVDDLSPWASIIGDNTDDTLLIAGLASNVAQSSPWWDTADGKIGDTVVKTPDVAMYGHADWSGLLRIENYATADLALQSAGYGTFFFYCNGYLDLGPGKRFQPGDAVFFVGAPWWGSASQCDSYWKQPSCSNDYNPGLPGGCPADLKAQYVTWKQSGNPPAGGFIWLYDSVVDCLLSTCCGGTEQTPVGTATAYRQAITDGLS